MDVKTIVTSQGSGSRTKKRTKFSHILVHYKAQISFLDFEHSFVIHELGLELRLRPFFLQRSGLAVNVCGD